MRNVIKIFFFYLSLYGNSHSYDYQLLSTLSYTLSREEIERIEESNKRFKDSLFQDADRNREETQKRVEDTSIRLSKNKIHNRPLSEEEIWRQNIKKSICVLYEGLCLVESEDSASIAQSN